jgi:hypothetical protein
MNRKKVGGLTAHNVANRRQNKSEIPAVSVSIK